MGWRLARYGFAAYFAFVGVAVLLFEAGLVPAPKLETEPRASAFLLAMTATGYVNALLAISFLAAAAAVLAERTTPLGLAIVAPSIAGIFLFHLLLSGKLLWGGLWLLWWLALAWRYRAGFAGLWNYGGTSR